MRQQRSTDTETAADHERRIRALERSPGRNPIYTDDRILSAPASDVDFSGFPANGTILELTWNAILGGTSTSDDFFLILLLNGQEIGNNEFGYNLAVPNQVGSQGSVTEFDTGIEYEAGVFGYISVGNVSWGELRFPGYSSPSGALVYNGDGGWSPGGDTGETDAWVVAGIDGGASPPLTELDIQAYPVTTGSDQQFAAGSRFTLTVY